MKTPRFTLSASFLALGLAFAQPGALAQQTITIDGNVSHDVFGNGDDNDNGRAPNDNPDDLANPPNGNTVNMTDGTVDGEVVGGRANSGNVTGNQVTVGGGTINDLVIGGRIKNSGTARENSVTITGGNIGQIFGGKAENGKAEENKVSIEGGEIKWDVFGGYAEGESSAAEASGNIVDMTAGTVKGGIAGGGASFKGSNGASASNNTVTVSGGTVSGNVNFDMYDESGDLDTGSGGAIVGGIAGSYSGAATASHNTVTVSDITLQDSGDHIISGGRANSYSGTATASGNRVTVSGSTVTGKVYGGWVSITGGGTGTATGNIVTLSGTSALSDLYGGLIDDGDGTPVAGDAFTGNVLNKNSAATVSGTIHNFEFINFGYSGYANINEIDTTPTTGIDSLTWVKLDTDSNDITLTGALSGSGGIIKQGTGVLTLSGDNSSYTGDMNVTEGTLSIANDSTNIGSGTYTLSGGTLKLTGASYTKAWTIANGTTSSRIESTYDSGDTTFEGAITLGEGGADTTDLTLASTNDSTSPYKLTIAGSITGNGNLFVAPLGHVELTNSNNEYTGETRVGEGAMLALGASAGLYNNHLTLDHGAIFIKDSSATHNLSNGIFNVNGEASYQGNLVADGAAVNLKPTDTYQFSSGDPILAITGSANLKDATVVVSASGSAVKMGDTVTMFSISEENENDLDAKAATIDVQGLMSIELSPMVRGADGKVTSRVGGAKARQETKSFNEGIMASAVAVGGAADHAAQGGMDAAKKSVTQRAAAGGAGGGAIPVGFSSVGGGSMRHKTGSHVDTEGYNLMGGIASGSQFATGQLTVGTFAEYGKGDYSTYNTFTTGEVRGKGNTEYRGVGFLAQFTFENGIYIDGTWRTGKVDNDYRSNIGGNRTAYGASSRYYGAHVGVGRIFQLGEDSIDVSTQYLWTHQKGDEVSLKGTEMTLDFDDVDSSRLRLDVRYTHALTRNLSGYAGVAWEKEFDSKAKSTLKSAWGESKIDPPELRGNTGRVELGFTTRPAANTPLTLDFGLQGYWGKREGITGGVKLNYRF